MPNFRKLRKLSLPFTITLISSFFVLTFISPSLLYFRGWEYFDDFVYPGYKDRSVLMQESGDSSRDFLFQRYQARNQISINIYGNRNTAYSENSNYDVLAVGDSQLFGSGVSDKETFASQLNLASSHNVYNASRVNGFSILNSVEFGEEWKYIILTSTERNGFSWYCPNGKFELPRDKPVKLEKRSIFSAKYAETYSRRLQGWANQKYTALISTKLYAPSKRIINVQHSFSQANFDKDLQCANSLDKEIRKLGIVPIFMLFPSNQTLYPKSASLTPNAFDLNYIRDLSRVGKRKGLMILDSVACLQKSEVNVASMHDTHLNAFGYKTLALCMSDFMNTITSR